MNVDHLFSKNSVLIVSLGPHGSEDNLRLLLSL